MNRQKESCTDCIHYSLNGFRPWCKECNKPINFGEVPSCKVDMNPITIHVPARYIKKVAIYLDIMMENDIVPDGEKADFLEIRRYFQGCSKL